jgi:hypothetical protein
MKNNTIIIMLIAVLLGVAALTMMHYKKGGHSSCCGGHHEEPALSVDQEALMHEKMASYVKKFTDDYNSEHHDALKRLAKTYGTRSALHDQQIEDMWHNYLQKNEAALIDNTLQIMQDVVGREYSAAEREAFVERFDAQLRLEGCETLKSSLAELAAHYTMVSQTPTITV